MSSQQPNGKPVLHVLARDSVKAIIPYASARRSMSGGSVWLNANENALATEYQLSGSYNRYPGISASRVARCLRQLCWR